MAFKTWLTRLWAKTRILALKIYHKLILGRDRWRIVKRNGLRYRVQYEFSSKRIIFHGITLHGMPEEEKMNLFVGLARQLGPDAHIDCGAHLGTHLLPVMAADIAGEYYAIEGSRATFAVLQENIKLNGFGDNVKVLNKVLSDKEREVVFCFQEERMSVGAGIEESISLKARATMNRKEIATTASLDSLVDLHNRRISLKIDVEGHELAVLIGARQLLANNQVLLQIEIWDHNTAHLNWLFANGFCLIASVGHDYYLRNYGEVA